LVQRLQLLPVLLQLLLLLLQLLLQPAGAGDLFGRLIHHLHLQMADWGVHVWTIIFILQIAGRGVRMWTTISPCREQIGRCVM